MFGLGGPEIILIVGAFVVLFGAKSIPQIARGLGKGIREFKDATNGIKSQIKEEVKDIEVPKIDVPKIDLD